MTMIFCTDDVLKADGKSIVALTEEQALKMMQDYQQAFPKAPTLVPAGLPGQPGLPMPFPPPPSR
jgi:hypothetical protein